MSVTGSCGAEELANLLLPALTAGKTFELPDVNLSDPSFQIGDLLVGVEPNALTNEDLTTGKVGGDGTFDAIMASTNAHLKAEFEKGRITGEQYTKAYIELTSQALSGAVQYLLGRDGAYWQAVTARFQAQAAQASVVKSRVELEAAKAQLKLIRFEANTAEVNYALAKMKLSTESVTYCAAKFNIDELMPLQKTMLQEQVETARAQTLNDRTDGTPIVGMLGKQRDLYDQQITSYKRDAESKAVKIFSDAWITMKTLDEGLLPPPGFQNANFDLMLSKIRDNTFPGV